MKVITSMPHATKLIVYYRSASLTVFLLHVFYVSDIVLVRTHFYTTPAKIADVLWYDALVVVVVVVVC